MKSKTNRNFEKFMLEVAVAVVPLFEKLAQLHLSLFKY